MGENIVVMKRKLLQATRNTVTGCYSGKLEELQKQYSQYLWNNAVSVFFFSTTFYSDWSFYIAAEILKVDPEIGILQFKTTGKNERHFENNSSNIQIFRNSIYV